MGEQPVSQSLRNGVSRTRRSVYVFGFSISFTLIIVMVNFLGYSGGVAEKTVDGMVGLIQMIAVSYLFTSSVDRSDILAKIGNGFNVAKGTPYRPPEAQTVNINNRVNSDESDGEAKG